MLSRLKTRVWTRKLAVAANEHKSDLQVSLLDGQENVLDYTGSDSDLDIFTFRHCHVQGSVAAGW